LQWVFDGPYQSDEYLQACGQEFRKAMELGATRILFDECLHHARRLRCFDTGHGHRYIFDEPTSNLDISVGARIIVLVIRLHNE